MNLSIVLIAISFVVYFVDCAHLVERHSNLNLIPSLTQESKNAVDNNVTKELETTDKKVLTELYDAFQEMTRAYKRVLTNVAESVQVSPTGNGIGFSQNGQQSLPVRIITENLRQLQSSVNRVTHAITDLFNRPLSENNMLFSEASKFIRLWSNQVQDVFSEFGEAINNIG